MSRSKDDIEIFVNKEIYDVKYWVFLLQVILFEFFIKIVKSLILFKVVGDVKGESEGFGSEEDKEKKKLVYRKILSWLFNDNENVDENKL